MPYKDPLKKKEYHRNYYIKNKLKIWKKEIFCINCKKQIWAGHSRCMSCEAKLRWKNKIFSIEKQRVWAKSRKGKKLSEVAKKNQSKAQKGIKRPYMIELNKKRNKIDNTFRRLKNDPEFIKKRFKGMRERPTRPEQFVIELIEEHNLPFKYIGDGELIISRLNPDFIATNGKNKIIEVFGRFWHQTYKNVEYKRSEIGRKEVLNKLGYDLLILWDDELLRENSNKILNKIKEFEIN
jgi:very-short-patch-repair endonuclease